MIVMKFGGSSLADKKQIIKMMEIVKKRSEFRPVIVCSAHKGVTDVLVDAAKAAKLGKEIFFDVFDIQSKVAKELGCDDNLLKGFYQEIKDLLKGISLLRELSLQTLDYITSFGERMSVRCIADYFSRNSLKAKAYDSWTLGFITDNNFGKARPLVDYKDRMRSTFEKIDLFDEIPIVTGFIGKSFDEKITTVGRNGSDLTATLIGSALNVDEIQIWTDTDGIMTADPYIVKEAQNIPLMSFNEASELARFGSRVLHPSSLKPAMESDIPVRVLNTNRPDHPGTIINKQGNLKQRGVTSVAYKENQIILTIFTTSMLAQIGFLGKVFNILAKNGVIVDVISTSEVSVSLTTDLYVPLKKALPELNKIGKCEIFKNKTVMVIVGRDLPNSGKLNVLVMKTLAFAEIQIEMFSFGKDSNNFSLVINDKEVDKAIRVLHRNLF